MLEIIIIVFTILLDQLTKYLAINYIQPIESVTVLENVFSITFVKNTGAAFGILQNYRWLFIILTIIISIAIIFYLFFYSRNNIILKICLSMILGGAIGNLIDRIRFGYVVDMFHFTLIDYPVFNIADTAVVLGTILLTYYLLFLSDKPLKG